MGKSDVTAEPSELANGPASGDALSDVLGVFRVRGAALLTGEFRAPWAWTSPRSNEVARVLTLEPLRYRVVVFHIVARGSCWLLGENGPVTLGEGDVVAFPRGAAHTMGAGEADPIPIAGLLPPQPWRTLPTLEYGGGGEATRIVCVYLRCDALPFDPLTASLPEHLIVRAGESEASRWFDATVRYLVHEARSGGPGVKAQIARLTETMFVEMIRLHMATLEAGDTGWLAGLKDPHIGEVLRQIHAAPLDPWTLDRLARSVGLSRTVLSERFRASIGKSVMRYLAEWRLQLAAQALAREDLNNAMAARIAGYASEAAFGRAFRRFAGLSPAAWRDAHRRTHPPGERATGAGQISA